MCRISSERGGFGLVNDMMRGRSLKEGLSGQVGSEKG